MGIDNEPVVYLEVEYDSDRYGDDASTPRLGMVDGDSVQICDDEGTIVTIRIRTGKLVNDIVGKLVKAKWEKAVSEMAEVLASRLRSVEP